MADTQNKKNETAGSKKSKKQVKPSLWSRIAAFWKGVRVEFRKVIWPTKESTKKQTILVVVVSVVLSAFIKAFDTLCQYVVKFIR